MRAAEIRRRISRVRSYDSARFHYRATSCARWAAYAVILAITCGLLTAAVWRVKPLLSANDRSRWCTVWSLVERHTFQIDEIDAVAGLGHDRQGAAPGTLLLEQAAAAADDRRRRLLGRAGGHRLDARRPDRRDGSHDPVDRERDPDARRRRW